MDHHCFSRADLGLATISSKSPTSYQNLNSLELCLYFCQQEILMSVCTYSISLAKALAVHFGIAFKHCTKSVLDKRKMI